MRLLGKPNRYMEQVLSRQRQSNTKAVEAGETCTWPVREPVKELQ